MVHQEEKHEKSHNRAHATDKITHDHPEDASHSSLVAEAWSKPDNAIANDNKAKATKSAKPEHANTPPEAKTVTQEADKAVAHRHAEKQIKSEIHSDKPHPKVDNDRSLTIPSLENAQRNSPVKERFIPSKVDNAELLFFSDAFQGLKKTDAVKEIQDVNGLINEQGKPLREGLKAIVAGNRVIGLGEAHTSNEINAGREWAIKELPNFRAEGITHLGVEVADCLKPIFEKFNRTKKGEPFSIPTEMIDPVADRALRNFSLIVQAYPDLLKLWTAARDNGIKLVPMDNSHLFVDDKVRDRYEASREKDMAKHVINVLNENPQNKMLVWIGNQHLADTRGHYKHTMFAEELNKTLKQRNKGETLATVFTATTNTDMEDFSPTPFAQRVKEPVLVPTKNAGKANDLGVMDMFADPKTDPKNMFPMSVYDHVAFFPKNRKTK